MNWVSQITLTRGDPRNSRSKRDRATRTCKTTCRKCGTYQCDEFPFASTTQSTRHVMKVNKDENCIHGSWLGVFYRVCNVSKGKRWV